MNQMSMFEGTRRRPADGFANRGMRLEEALKWQHAMYRARGLAAVDKQYLPSLPVKDGRWARVIGKGLVDFCGTLKGGQFVTFDAKDCAGKRVDLARLQPHQLEYLELISSLGGLAFVLTRFAGDTLYTIPVEAWTGVNEARRASRAIYVDALDWTAQSKASIAMNDLPERWRVDGYNWLPNLERFYKR